MGYRIRVVPEVEAWLGELRGSDPGAADLVDGALDALREGGAGLGPPLVLPVEAPAHQTRQDLDYTYQRQVELLTRVRRGVADVATTRKRLELQIKQLHESVVELDEQCARAIDSGDDHSMAMVRSLSSAAARRLADLSLQYAGTHSDGEHLAAASQRLQAKVDNFGRRKEAVRGAETSSLELSELRPGAPGSAGIRILFTVLPPDTALLLAAGTERDWLRAWYAETILHCRDRYERHQTA